MIDADGPKQESGSDGRTSWSISFETKVGRIVADGVLKEESALDGVTLPDTSIKPESRRVAGTGEPSGMSAVDGTMRCDKPCCLELRNALGDDGINGNSSDDIPADRFELPGRERRPCTRRSSRGGRVSTLRIVSMTKVHTPVIASHIRIVPSADPEMMEFESSEKTTELTQHVCPVRRTMAAPVFVYLVVNVRSHEPETMYLASGEKAIEVMGFVWVVGKTEAALHVRKSQNRRLLSADPETTVWPFGENTTTVTYDVCQSRQSPITTEVPASGFHKRTVRSIDPEARRARFGENATDVT
jgi:hypothetical protein